MKCIAAILLLALAAVASAETKPVEVEGARQVVSGPEVENSVVSGRSKRGYVLGAYSAPLAYSAYTAPVAYSAYTNYPYAYSAYSAYPYYASSYSAPYYYV
ncbi:uncharacterized protein LOC122499325 [Leptopilina heterotoma]|uniref:uncharacterized protein LOC122499325 n=1 Tax=Leptopilina heterotoma TaxID=63436 RepID=UPI001CA82D0F|nr:uncharacterized protein LOC122499325 [Leptopilina heterotoma]